MHIPGYRSLRLRVSRTNRIPVLAPNQAFPEAGGLMSHAPDPQDIPRLAAGYAARLLNGATVVDLPVAGPSRFHVTVNLKAAEAIGFSFPDSVIAEATRVIR